MMKSTPCQLIVFFVAVCCCFASSVFAQNCLSNGVVGGTATSGNTSLCAGGYTLISITGSTTGSGLSYQWEASADSTNWSAVAGATAFELSTNQSNLYYRRKINCSNGISAYSSGIRINARGFLNCYCVPYGACNSIYSITSVSYGNVNNASACGPNGYTNYSSSAPAADATQGTYMPISVRVGGGVASRTVDCWLDANHNSVFETNEMSVLTSLSGNIYSGYVKIPFRAQTGVTLLRIIYASATYTYICSPGYQYSETEDYYLNITANTTTTATGFSIYVKPTVSGGDNSGRDWTNATTNLLKAMQMAANGDTVKLAKGTYYTGPGYRDGFPLHDSMVVLGGYPAVGSPTAADRNISLNPTVLSGFIAANSSTIPNYHVLYASGSMAACVVDGLILQNGGYYASEGPSQGRGGGFSAENGANPTLRNCVIRDNNSYGYGTAIAVNRAAPVLQNCIIEKNAGYYSPVLIENGSSIVFQNLLAVYNGGNQLVQVDSSAVSFTNSTLACNNLNGVLISAKRQSVVNVTNTICFFNPAYNSSWQNSSYDSADIRLESSNAFFRNSITQVYNQGMALLPGYHPKFKDTASSIGPDGLYFTADDGFSLNNPCSPAINAGANTLAAGIAVDILGNARTYEGTTDLGAYEVQQNKTPVPTVVYVNAAATGGLNNGSNWADAFTDMHLALQTCSDTIKMAAGNYAPLQSPAQKAYWLDNRRVILGAYPASGNPSNADRNYNVHITSINGNTNTSSKASMVIQGINLDSTAVLDGIQFTGIGNPNSFLKQAALYYIKCNNPTISNCSFKANNDLVFWGRDNRNVLLKNCSFSDNKLPEGSYSLELLAVERSGATTFRNCVFQNNELTPETSTIGEYGIMLNIKSSNPTFDSCSFLQNQANIFTCQSSNPVIKESRFINNYASDNTTDLVNINSNSIVTNCVFKDSAMSYAIATNGGSVRNTNSSPVFTNCRFTNCMASYGGAIYNDSSLARFTKCVFSNCNQPIYNIRNSNILLNNCIATNSTGAFMINQKSNPALYHCSIVNGNSAAAGVINNDNISVPEINNCIFWKNYQGVAIDTAFLNNRRDVVSTVSGQFTVRNSMFEFLDAGSANGNIAKKDPRFINFANPIGPDSLWFTADDGLRLCDCSPAINSGNNAYSLSTTDIADIPRPFGSTVDRGAYELQAVPAASQSKTFYVRADATGFNTGEDWANAYTSLQHALRNACADTIKMAAGTYKPALQNRDSLFSINRSIALLGSYSAVSPYAPGDVDLNPTVLSGNIGLANDTADNSRRLLTAFYVDTLRIDGFVFSDANSISPAPGTFNVFDAQYVLNLDIVNTRFYKNYSKSSTMFLSKVSKYNIRKTVFSQNKGPNGGAIRLSSNGYSKKITDCIFNKNECSGVGGAVYCGESGVAFVNCLFNKNLAVKGGGMYIDNNQDIQVTNCTFSDNKVNYYISSAAAGIHSTGASWQGGYAGPNIENCIFTTNSLLGNDYQSCFTDVYYNKNGYEPDNCRLECRIHHSAVSTQPIYNYGGGNISPNGIVYKNMANPIGPDNRWFTADDGLQLSVCSDGLNKGFNASNTAATDLAGSPRIVSGTIDLGAYEFSGAPDGIQLLTAANDSLLANKEITDAAGWTHYYKDCFYLMSVKKAGQDIGTIGDGAFSLQVKTLPAYGSNVPADLSAAAYISPGVSWKVMNRYWKINTTRQLTDSLQVRFPFTATDFRDLGSSNPALATPAQMVFYKTDGTIAPTSIVITAANFHKYLHAAAPSAKGWVLTATDTASYTADYFIKTLTGGGGGGVLDTTCVSNTSTWLGITPDWSSPGNWSMGQAPTVCTYAIVNAGVSYMPEVSTPNAACYKLTLAPGTTITIHAGANLSVIGQ